MRKTREELVEVFRKTSNDLKEGYYINRKGEEIVFDDSKLRKKTVMYQDHELKNKVVSKSNFETTKIYVQNIDSFLKAIEMGPSCAVLNMASSRTAGGGVIGGSRAQEEDLCRRSNLVESLYSFTNKGRDMFGFRKHQDYPIDPYGGIYSPGVSIYKDTKYIPYDNPFKADVISVSAMIRPDYDPETFMISKKQVHIVKNKIRSIFRIAILNGKTKLVLGAFGCGAFCNPPSHVAKLFKEILEEDEFKNSFEEICFAILDDGNTGKAHNPEGNYKPFVEVFGENK